MGPSPHGQEPRALPEPVNPDSSHSLGEMGGETGVQTQETGLYFGGCLWKGKASAPATCWMLLARLGALEAVARRQRQQEFPPPARTSRPRLARDGCTQHTVADKALEMTTSHEATRCPPPSSLPSFLPPPGALEINLWRTGCCREPGPGWRSCRVTRPPHWWNFLLGLLAWSSRSWHGVNWLPYTASYLRSLSTSCRAP